MRRFLVLLSALVAVEVAADNEIKVRVTPPNKAQLLATQRFDIRVEASTPTATDQIQSLKVTIDGVDVTSRGTLDAGTATNVKGWTYRGAALGIAGPRVFVGTAAGVSASSAPINGSSSRTLTIRPWTKPAGAAVPPPTALLDAAPEFQAATVRMSRAVLSQLDADPSNELHLGANHPAFHTRVAAADGQRRAKNVILLIGDGMGIASRTAARVLSKGYTQGKANATLAMDRFPFNGMLMTSSLNSLITDSAPGAHNYSTGNKTNNGMEGVFPDNTADDADNPRLEHLSEFLNRSFGMVTGIVSDAFITDATPAAFLAHTQNRGNGTLVASQYVDNRNETALKVLLGGGSYHFIPKSTPGSKRTDERNVLNDFKAAGYTFVDSATALKNYTPGPNGQLLGLFNLDNINVAYDKLKQGDPSVVKDFPDQPMLRDMAQKAIDTLKQYPNGFFLMVEGAHIDKQAHRMDAERSIYEVIQFDQAVEAALAFAIQTNTDDDPNNDTLVIVSADHECAGVALPGVSRPDKKGTRDYVKTYNYSDGTTTNDSKTANFTTYAHTNGSPFPDSPSPDYKLIVNFGSAPDHYEDWTPSALPRNASAAEGSGFEPGILQGGVAVANPTDPKKSTTGALLLTGVIENGANGGEAQTQAVHTLSDIPISAYGPGASQFGRVTDNTEAFFSIFNSIIGSYPIPTQY